MKISKFMVIGILLLLAAILIYFKFIRINPNTKFEKTDIVIKNETYSLEIAKSIQQLSLGLGKREILCQKCGMIFIFSFEGTLPFWMKDTLIPLDIIWINSQNQVVSIQTAPVEPNNSNLKQYKNNQPAKYVIELNAGVADKIGLKIGDTIQIPKL